MRAVGRIRVVVKKFPNIYFTFVNVLFRGFVPKRKDKSAHIILHVTVSRTVLWSILGLHQVSEETEQVNAGEIHARARPGKISQNVWILTEKGG